ncbi:MAG: DUF2268 domain-containing putative Zn-dependent protease, partial [Lewinella sp.]
AYTIETSDIKNFWAAYDKLALADTREDSIQIIQEQYLDVGTVYFQKFVEARDFTAEEYIENFALYPKFWQSIRPLTEKIEHRKGEIKAVFESYREELPNFKRPDVCFAIGCLRTGGTVSDDLILIGSEIAASSEAVDKSEMTGWLHNVIGTGSDIVSMIAHETIHTQQRKERKLNLLTGVMTEGIADFLADTLLSLSINKEVYAYGDEHRCALFAEFKQDLKANPDDYGNWIYQGNRAADRPADLGYYIGYQIARMYYEKTENNGRALKDLLKVKRYESIFARSGFMDMSCR